MEEGNVLYVDSPVTVSSCCPPCYTMWLTVYESLHEVGVEADGVTDMRRYTWAVSRSDGAIQDRGRLSEHAVHLHGYVTPPVLADS